MNEYNVGLGKTVLQLNEWVGVRWGILPSELFATVTAQQGLFPNV